MAPQAEIFGPYALLKRLGQGGMGSVHLGRLLGAPKPNVPRGVVIKRLHPEFGNEKEFVGRFRHEAEIAVAVQSSHVAKIFDVGSVDGELYIAMEYIPGWPLSQLRGALVESKRPPPIAALADMFSGALMGLEALHSAKDPLGRPLEVVHRDLSPRNLMIGDDGAVRLIDLGLGKSNAQGWRTATGVVMGSPGYMAPEQLTGATVDRRTDLYVVSIVLYEMLTLRHYITRGGAAHEMLFETVNPRYLPPSTWRNDVPPALDALMKRALSVSPKDRFQSAAEMLGALREAVPPPADARAQTLALIEELLGPEQRMRQAEIDLLLRVTPEESDVEDRTMIAPSVVFARSASFPVPDSGDETVLPRGRPAGELSAAGSSPSLVSLVRPAAGDRDDDDLPPLPFQTKSLPVVGPTKTPPTYRDAIAAEGDREIEPTLPSQTLHGYRIGRALVETERSALHEATQVSLARRMVIELLAPALAANDAYVAGFLDRAQRLASLQHPNVVQITDLIREDQPRRIGIVMEKWSGPSLAEVLNGAPLGSPLAIALMLELGEALEAIHRAGFVHLEVEPSNIVFAEPLPPDDSTPARLLVLPPKAPPVTAAAPRLDRPRYLAPEQLIGETPSTATDVFAFAEIVHELGTGKSAFPEERSAVLEAKLSSRARVKLGAVLRLDFRDADPLDRALANALSRDPARRPPIKELLDALRAAKAVLESPAFKKNAEAQKQGRTGASTAAGGSHGSVADNVRALEPVARPRTEVAPARVTQPEAPRAAPEISGDSTSWRSPQRLRPIVMVLGAIAAALTVALIVVLARGRPSNAAADLGAAAESRNAAEQAANSPVEDPRAVNGSNGAAQAPRGAGAQPAALPSSASAEPDRRAADGAPAAPDPATAKIPGGAAPAAASGPIARPTAPAKRPVPSRPGEGAPRPKRALTEDKIPEW